mmetsp:Transcript_25631/g.55136  ORF Transcript_25631/g.55136 Transcript_25631/m.55136 type:complete len:172 (+) Transcript_25631:228-743(+)
MPRCASGLICRAPEKVVPPSINNSAAFSHPCHNCRAGCHACGDGCAFEFDEVKDQINISEDLIKSSGANTVICRGCFQKLCKTPADKFSPTPPTAPLSSRVRGLGTKRKRIPDDDQDQVWDKYDRVHGGAHPNNRGTVMDRNNARHINNNVAGTTTTGASPPLLTRVVSSE